MKKRFMNRREMLVLGLPLVLLGIGAVFLSAREKKRIERESGPLRLVVTSAKPMGLTPREAWQGYDVKYRLDYELQGKNISKLKLVDSEIITSGLDCLIVTGQQDKPQHFPGVRIIEYRYVQHYIPAPIKIIDIRSSKSNNLYSTVLIERNAFPSGKATLQLSPKFEGLDRRYKRFVSHPIRWSHTIDKDIKAINADRTAPKYISSYVTVTPPIVGEHRIAANKAGHNYDDRTTTLQLFWEVNGLAQNRGGNDVKFLNSRFEDEKGNEIQKFPKKDNVEGIEFHSLQGALNPTYGRAEDKYYTDTNLNLHGIPKTYGAVFLRSNFSLNDSWAVPFCVEVRPAWVCQTTNKLKIENVKITAPYVAVTVNYLGRKTVEYNSQAFPYFSTMRDDNTNIDPPVEPNRDRLISNWSQHLEKNGETLFYTSQINKYPKSYCEVKNITELGNNRYRINYTVNHPKPAGMKFKAEIGIWGDGFIPIEITIPKSKH